MTVFVWIHRLRDYTLRIYLFSIDSAKPNLLGYFISAIDNSILSLPLISIPASNVQNVTFSTVYSLTHLPIPHDRPVLDKTDIYINDSLSGTETS
jgi:hypothetical protein